MTSAFAPSTEEVMQRLRPFGLFFEKSLKDLIKGIRAHSETPEQLGQFLSQALSECREEVNSAEFNLKTNAVLKLTYLEMYGYDMSWANFHILEVMSSNKIQQKRVGYLAASQSFYKDSDILMLATNLLKKDLKYDGLNDKVKMGIALSGLSTMVTSSLARDLCDDLISMLSSNRPYIRKKAIAALFKVFLDFPEALRDNFESFVARLEDEDSSVVSATISVICELSKKNPVPFIPLSPLFYEMLINIDNNWIIIRLLKLFTNLSQVESKLKPKLLPKILELMDLTSATSVIYESINCIVKGGMLGDTDLDTAMNCLEQITKFCNSNDPNLRYVSVVLFYKIGKINTEFISEYDDLVILLLKDVDISIRSRALELLEGAANEDNLPKTVKILLKQFIEKNTVPLSRSEKSSGTMDQFKTIEVDMPAFYKVKMAFTILKICSMNSYANLVDFEWYITVLRDLCFVSMELKDENLGRKLGEEWRNILVKVPEMRGKAMGAVLELVSSNDISTYLPSVLKECIWCIGEYSNLVDNGDDLITLLMRVKFTAADIGQILIHALLKIFSNWCNNRGSAEPIEVKRLVEQLITFLETYSLSKFVEVQERSYEYLEFLKLCDESIDVNIQELPLLITDVLPSLFNSYELNPISLGTQKRLQSNVTIDLETPFLSESDLQNLLNRSEYKLEAGENIPENLSDDSDSSIFSQHDDLHSPDLLKEEEYTRVDTKRQSDEIQRKIDRQTNPFYLDDGDDARVIRQKSNSLVDLEPEESPGVSNAIRLSKDERIPVENPQKKNKKKKRLQVLADETVPDTHPSTESDEHHDNNSATSGNTFSNKINLRNRSKLEGFDFASNKSLTPLSPDSTGEAQADLDKLRAKFANQSLEDSAQDEEVIVIKRKKPRKSKKSKKKPKDKENSANDKQDTHQNAGEV
ncbi:LAMI_0D08768g1_1 [Lachancea mirantina]|uniref:AP-3 complex subunit delta n=1 Tax=Lachancea mirantina TaxID=1230905 RepID=A0A1G4JD76_9SACH|nr:LAMI_0D08768g1_1 [Lachancea mirantina]